MFRMKLGIAFALCLVGCAASDKSVLTNPVYQGASLAGRSLLLLPLVDVKIEDLGGFEASFREQTRDSMYDPAAILAGLFLERLQAISEAAPKRVIGLLPDTAGYQDTLLQLPEQYFQPDGTILADGPLIPMRFCFPGGGLLRNAEYEPDLGLQISHLHFTVEEKQTQDAATILLVGYVAGELLVPKPKVLHLSGTFLIYDYRTGAPVAYGWLEAASTFKFMMEKSDWKKVVSDAVVTIVKNTPLKGKKFQERLNNKEQFKGNHALGYH
jgi:hypothetical protein